MVKSFRPIYVSLSSDIYWTKGKHISDERETSAGRLLFSKKKTIHCRNRNYPLQ